MVIQHNIPALNSHRNLLINNTATAKNLEKLSSGYRINRAGDDAAGLAISEKMRGQIRGLAMAEQNVSNGINLIQTAEGGLQETHAILQRMRELAVQASNGTYDTEDRKNLQMEIEALVDEIDRIAESTAYNGINLLDGSVGDVAKRTNAITGLPGAAAAFPGAGICGLELDGTLTNPAIAYSGIELDINVSSSGKVTINSNQGSITGLQETTPGSGVYKFTLQLTGADKVDFEFTVPTTSGAEGEAGMTLKFDLATNGDFDFDTTSTQKTFDPASTNRPLFFQIGCNGGRDQQLEIEIGAMDATSLLVKTLDITDPNDANQAITTISDATNTVSAQRAQLGAYQNRLEHTLNNLGVTKENLTASESTIRDVDMAKEMMEFTKNNILVQSAQAMLAQATQLPQGVLQLLR